MFDPPAPPADWKYTFPRKVLLERFSVPDSVTYPERDGMSDV